MIDLKMMLSTGAAFLVGTLTAAAWMAAMADSEDRAREARVDTALSDMRAELARNRQASGWRPAPLVAAADPEIEPETPWWGRGGVPTPDDEEVEMPSPEEQVAEVAARVDALEAAMHEPDDRAWSTAMEEDVDGALDKYRTKLPADAEVDARARCAADLCRVELTYADGHTLKRYGMSFFPPRGLGQGFVQFTDDADTNTYKMTAFYAKDGEDLP